MRFIIILLAILYLAACDQKSEIVTIKKKQIIPEGIAVDKNGSIYLSNLYTKDIIRTESDGTNPKQIPTKHTGNFAGVGMSIQNNMLFALGNSNGDGYQSVLQVIDLETLSLLKSYQLYDSSHSFLNDLAISAKGKFYITNTYKQSIYTVKDDHLEEFISSEEIQYPNGIAISDSDTLLYIASSSKGIKLYDLSSEQFIAQPTIAGQAVGIDGLKYFENSLIAVQNGSRNKKEHVILRLYLDEMGNVTDRIDTLYRNHKNFNIPTTLDIKDGWVYCLANSQMENLDQNEQLINSDKLTNTFILKFKLD